MGKVVALEDRRMRALSDELLPVLRDRGSVMVDAVDVDDVDRWRRAARVAGRRLGCRVRTGVASDGSRVWAASLDYELSEADYRSARAFDALFDSLPAPRPGPHGRGEQ